MSTSLAASNETLRRVTNFIEKDPYQGSPKLPLFRAVEVTLVPSVSSLEPRVPLFLSYFRPQPVLVQLKQFIQESISDNCTTDCSVKASTKGGTLQRTLKFRYRYIKVHDMHYDLLFD